MTGNDHANPTPAPARPAGPARPPWLLPLVVGTMALLAAVAITFAGPTDVPAAWTRVLYVLGGGGLFTALMQWRWQEECDAAPPALRRRYVRELTVAMAVYVLTLVASVWLLKRVDEEALRAIIALLPVPAIAMALRAIVRYVRDVDELQQRIELEAVSIATCLVSLLYLAGGLLQAAKVIDVPASAAMIWMFPLICLVYGLVKIIVIRRFQ